jgi:hypothetical protein
VIHLIGLDNPARTTKGLGIFLAHRLADAVAHEPSGLVCDFQHAMQLVSRYAFLARGHQVKAENPLSQRDVAALHDGAVGYGEVTTAGVALVKAGAVGLAFQTLDTLDRTAVRTGRTIRPADRLHVLPREVFVMENGISQIDGHSGFLLGRFCTRAGKLCQRDNWEICPSIGF